MSEKNMNERLKGKRLLFLGGMYPYCELIGYCKEMGITALVTDNLPNSVAKSVADESFMVSITDVPALVELCKKEKVDGIFIAFMDYMLGYARQLADIMGYPFYATQEQINMSHDKSLFKKLSMECGLPVPYDFTKEIQDKGIKSKNVRFPVIVKPVDQGGGSGISICRDVEQLKAAYEYAMEMSPSKRVLVEEYVEGLDVTATYTMKNGEYSLSVFRDKLLSQDHENIQSQADILLNPSAYLDDFIQNVHPAICRLLKNVGAVDGTCFFQGIRKDNGEIVIFELGYRPNSALDYRHISQVNGINYMKMMLAHALTGEMLGYDLSMDKPYFPEYCITFNIWAHPGVIAKLEGLEDVLKLENVTFAEFRAPIGKEISASNPYLQGVFRAIIRDKDMTAIQATISKIQSIIKVEDINGNNMLYKPFDVHRLDGMTLKGKENTQAAGVESKCSKEEQQ